MLVGCGGSSNDSKSSGGDGKKLVYWAMWSKDEPQAKVIQDAIAKYTEDTGVEVDVQFKGRSGQREGLQPALDAKQTIDLFDEDVNRVNGSWGKYLLDLEDVAKDYESEHGNETLFKIARAAYEDGTLHSIPYQPSIFGFFYNKTLFDKAGIKEVPTTWDELDAVCAKLKDAGITPITADDAYMTSFIGYHLARYIGQDGVKSLVTGEEVNGQNVTWMMREFLQQLRALQISLKKVTSQRTLRQMYIRQDRIRNLLLEMQQLLSADHGFQMKQKLL